MQGRMPMDNDLTAQIRQSMREKDTEDLLAIWARSDGEIWSDEAYTIARETLLERGIDPPEPVAAGQADAEAEDDEDVYHDFNRALSVASWATNLSWFFIGLCVLIVVLEIASLFSFFR